MTTQEFSDEFDVLLNSYALSANYGDSNDKIPISCNEYEKSVFLTNAQEELVVNLYNGKNPYGLSFESTEEARRYLENLVVKKSYNDDDPNFNDYISYDFEDIGASYTFELPKELAFIVNEEASVFKKDKCIKQTPKELQYYTTRRVKVIPVKYDELQRLLENPFKKPNKNKVLRVDYGVSIIQDGATQYLEDGKRRVRIITSYKGTSPSDGDMLQDYTITYIRYPKPIILASLTQHVPETNPAESINLTDIRSDIYNDIGTEVQECELNPLLHRIILERAVQLALQYKRLNTNTNSN